MEGTVEMKLMKKRFHGFRKPQSLQSKVGTARVTRCFEQKSVYSLPITKYLTKLGTNTK